MYLAMPPAWNSQSSPNPRNQVYCGICKCQRTRYYVTQHENSVFPSPTPAPPPPSFTPILITEPPTDSEGSEFMSEVSSEELSQDEEDFEMLPTDVRHLDILTVALESDTDPGHLNSHNNTESNVVEFDFNALGVQDQWAHIKTIIRTNWALMDDWEDDDRVPSDEDERLPLEDDSNIFEDDVEADDFWYLGEFDWEQFKVFGKNESHEAQD
ncbi:hypothetical protein L218DRAFT_949786 [Marasmius fiardii PR-910]|nr:hypothetical protein L218DRAFT_949786 [Marasmius fiardii PR-910]